MAMNKVIISCAVTGSIHTPSMSPHLPVTAEEIAQSALDAAVDAWTETLGQRSPTALALAKRSFNADSENIRGISMLSLNAVKLFYDTAESKEGVNAFTERRTPDFHAFVK